MRTCARQYILVTCKKRPRACGMLRVYLLHAHTSEIHLFPFLDIDFGRLKVVFAVLQRRLEPSYRPGLARVNIFRRDCRGLRSRRSSRRVWETGIIKSIMSQFVVRSGRKITVYEYRIQDSYKSITNQQNRQPCKNY